jgi:uncharacterized surface protein with fasciclin (FAS1) repeats
MRGLPSLLVAALVSLSLGTAAASPRDIVETAEETGTFKTLLAAADKAGVLAKLKGEGPYTLLAPTDDAFARLDPGVVDRLMQPESKADLAALLEHHIIPGKVLSVDIRQTKGATVVANARGGSLTFSGTDVIRIEEATIVETDVIASNGVIHVVDTVIDPEP